MAVPCLVNVTNADVENWQRLERLLCELFVVLRALLTPSESHEATPYITNTEQRGPPPPPAPQGKLLLLKLHTTDYYITNILITNFKSMYLLIPIDTYAAIIFLNSACECEGLFANRYL